MLRIAALKLTRNYTTLVNLSLLFMFTCKKLTYMPNVIATIPTVFLLIFRALQSFANIWNEIIFPNKPKWIQLSKQSNYNKLILSHSLVTMWPEKYTRLRFAKTVLFPIYNNFENLWNRELLISYTNICTNTK